MSLDTEKLLEGLANGYFFNPRMMGVKRVRTLVSRWVDEYTEDKTLRHLFSKAVKTLSLPRPRYFAITLGILGWWSEATLFKEEVGKYKGRVEKVRAKFLAKLADPFFYSRFVEIANKAGVRPAELIDSIAFSVPYRKVRIEETSESQIEDTKKLYVKDINRRILRALRQLRALLTRGIVGRKTRVERLLRLISILRTLNVAEYKKDLVDDISKAFDSIANLNRKGFPKHLDKYINDEKLPMAIKTEITRLLKDAEVGTYWRLK